MHERVRIGISWALVLMLAAACAVSATDTADPPGATANAVALPASAAPPAAAVTAAATDASAAPDQALIEKTIGIFRTAGLKAV